MHSVGNDRAFLLETVGGGGAADRRGISGRLPRLSWRYEPNGLGQGAGGGGGGGRVAGVTVLAWLGVGWGRGHKRACLSRGGNKPPVLYSKRGWHTTDERGRATGWDAGVFKLPVFPGWSLDHVSAP